MEGNLEFEDRGEKEEERTRNKTRFSREKVSPILSDQKMIADAHAQ